MDQDFANFIVKASHPLVPGAENTPPSGHCSGTIVEYRGQRIIMTVSHLVKPDESWAVELANEGDKGAKLFRIGQMDYIQSVSGGKVEEVDFAFARIPETVQAKFQMFSELGEVEFEDDRVVLRSDLSTEPEAGIKYGFAGLTRPCLEIAPPGFKHPIASSELTIETELTFIETVNGLDRYNLGKKHPGHDQYRGCSGAPLLSIEGDLVGLVVSGCERDSIISALPLRNYRSMIDIELGLIQDETS